GAKSELPCEVRFPELEPLCVITNLVRVPVDPARAVQIGGRHLEPVQKLASYIQEAGTARAAEVLPAGRREHIALQARHAQRQLAGGLTGIQQIRDSGSASDLPDLLSRLNEPAVGGHVREGNECSAFASRLVERRQIHGTLIVARDDLDLHTARL